jgi:hypothetical protein
MYYSLNHAAELPRAIISDQNRYPKPCPALQKNSELQKRHTSVWKVTLWLDFLGDTWPRWLDNVRPGVGCEERRDGRIELLIGQRLHAASVLDLT